MKLHHLTETYLTEAKLRIGDEVSYAKGRKFGRVKGFVMMKGKSGIDPMTGMPFGKVQGIKVSPIANRHGRLADNAGEIEVIPHNELTPVTRMQLLQGLGLR